MERSFWRQKWEKSEIAFHEGAPNSLLVKHFTALALREGAAIFLPLCGKTRDIHWLLSRNFRVVGAELSRIAVEQLFAELKVEPTKAAVGPLTRYSAHFIDIFLGDIFDMTARALGSVDATYDRAALVALPEKMRPRYAAHIVDITAAAPQLLISYVYDQSAIDGPPFSVSNEEICRLYGDIFNVSVLEKADVPGGLKGKCAATENVLLLRPSRSR